MKFEFTIHGPIKGGKNHVGITRTGRRYPLKAWAEWRDQVVAELRVLFPNPEMIRAPARMVARYWNKDLKRRDVPAMVDAIFHCIERAGLIEDDGLIRTVHWIWEGHDRKSGRAEIVLQEI